MPVMPAGSTYRGRRAATIANDALRVTVLEEGGHIAEIHDAQSGINPLWTPPWTSVEPSAFDRAAHPEFGSGADAKLLAGIMGHNLCLDIFGGPSAEEAAAGMTAHGDGSVARYDIDAANDRLTMRARLPLAQIQIERRIALQGRTVRIQEAIENLCAFDRPIGWTEHVTLGPPFLQRGVTEFRASATRSKVFDGQFGADDYLQPAAEFTWPSAPRRGGGGADLRRYADGPRSSAYTAHRMDPSRDTAFFVAFVAASRLAFGYVWKTSDFPWLGIWEENCSRTGSPWNGKTLTRGMEFGVSPFPESRREMVARTSLFDTPAFRWLPARGHIAVEYWVVIRTADEVPESLEWPS
jgi:hypothetical protein